LCQSKSIWSVLWMVKEILITLIKSTSHGNEVPNHLQLQGDFHRKSFQIDKKAQKDPL